ncbi:MAG: ankyrin repeat domain-containing protein [Bryobacterales bacterium]|nr:ankyrin repeat domain-containing protein [Bryobacterales bacterium]MDE0625031.1 ankyrin repeat domain-containing protein [Bryobacterales bacterium]
MNFLFATVLAIAFVIVADMLSIALVFVVLSALPEKVITVITPMSIYGVLLLSVTNALYHYLIGFYAILIPVKVFSLNRDPRSVKRLNQVIIVVIFGIFSGWFIVFYMPDLPDSLGKEIGISIRYGAQIFGVYVSKQTILGRNLHEEVQSHANLLKIEKLIRAGVNIDFRHNQDLTAFHRSIESSNIALVEYLIAQGANIHAKTTLGYNALHIAARSTSPETIQLLIDHGVRFDCSADSNGVTPLMLAANSNTNPDVCRILISNGADINHHDKKGHSILHHAVGHNDNPEVVGSLIDLGADIDWKNDSGFTPLEIAMMRNDEVLQELLRNAGGKSPSFDTAYGYYVRNQEAK